MKVEGAAKSGVHAKFRQPTHTAFSENDIVPEVSELDMSARTHMDEPNQNRTGENRAGRTKSNRRILRPDSRVEEIYMQWEAPT